MGYYHRGIVQTELNRFDGAIESFLRVLKFNPSNADAKIKLALVHGRKGDFEMAKRLIKDAYSRDMSLNDGFAMLGEIRAETAPQGSSEVLDIIDLDRAKGRLSTFWKLVASKHYIWGRRFEDAELLIIEAYRDNVDAKAGYSRIATAALMIGEHDYAIRFWCKDRELGREDRRSAMRYDLMRMNKWNGEKKSVFLYRDPSGPEFEQLIPLLERFFKDAASAVTMETPPRYHAFVAKADPRVTTTENTIFGEGELFTRLPSAKSRLSYSQLILWYEG